jgi:hypothetical protein
MDVNVMHSNESNSPAALLRLAAVSGSAAALLATVLAGHVAEPLIIVAIIVAASIVGWQRTTFIPARVHSHHRFTVVPRAGDGFVTVDSNGARMVSRRLAFDRPTR